MDISNSSNTEIDLSRTFTFSEQIAILLYKSSNKKTHYETYIITQILLELDYNYEYHKKTFEFLVKRHENLRAYFKLDEETQTVERVYDDNYIPKVIPLVYLNEDATDENLDKTFFEYYDKDYSIEKLPGIKVLIVKANNGLFSIIRGHHCYLELESAKVIHNEGIFLYKKINEFKGEITFEESVRDMPKPNSFLEYVKESHELVKLNKPLVTPFLNKTLQNYQQGDKANTPVVGTEYYYDKFKIDIKGLETEMFLLKNNIKSHQVFKTIFQIAIAKYVGTNIPLILNVNSKRTDKWCNHYSCQVKNNPFYVDVDFSRTFEEQLKYNDENNREMLKVYSNLDAFLIYGDAQEKMPIGQYTLNVCYNNEEFILFRPDLRKETKLEVDWPMNMYFEVYYRSNEFILFFMISKLAGVSEQISIKIKNFMIENYINLNQIWSRRINEFQY